MEWSVDPDILSIGFFKLRYYSLLFLTGLLGGYLLVKKIYGAEQKPVQWVEPLFTYIFIGTVIGMRLGHTLFYEPEYYLSHPLEILRIDKGGYASHGGFAGVIVAIYLYCKKYKEIGFLWLTDRVSIAAMFCAGCIRLGNFFNSEILGRATDFPLAITFTLVDNIPRHPAQLYEAFGYFVIAGVLYAVYRRYDRDVPKGLLFGLVLILGMSWRFIVEFVKEPQVAFESTMALNMGQWLSLPFILIGGFLVKRTLDARARTQTHTHTSA